ELTQPRVQGNVFDFAMDGQLEADLVRDRVVTALLVRVEELLDRAVIMFEQLEAVTHDRLLLASAGYPCTSRLTPRAAVSPLRPQAVAAGRRAAAATRS